MALPELTIKQVERLLSDFCEKRVPAHAKSQVRLSFEIKGDMVILFEDRVGWNDPSKWSHMPVAQFRFNSDKLMWSLYYADRNDNWHLYQMKKSQSSFEALVDEVDKDPVHRFWG